jgi:FSR family fosmidomycin resistance protein-like MFS transporter
LDAHEFMPTQIGLISGLFMGIAMGAGGIGGSVSGVIADHFCLTTTLATFPVIVLLAAVLFARVGYPSKKDGPAEG